MTYGSAAEELSAEQITAITAFVDIQAPPPGDLPTAHVIFGTNQATPAELVAERYHAGLAPLVIVTGGVNRHNGIIEGREFYRLLTERGVPAAAIRCEDQSVNTWQNVELARPFLREALQDGLALTAVSKWYHRRTVHVLKTLLPEIGAFYALSWEPIYAGTSVTRQSWPNVPDGRRRVVREWQEIPRRIAEGDFAPAEIIDGVWR